jgi:hypothetical protein
MDVVLVSITGIALILAVAMGLVLLKLLREERQRSEARVALLTATANVAVESFPIRLDADEEVLPLSAENVGHAGLFAPNQEASPWGRRLAVAGLLGAALVIAGYTLVPRTTNGVVARAAAAATAQPLPLELLALSHTQEADGLTITGTVQNPRTGAPASQIAAVAFLFGTDGAYLASGRAALDYARLAPGDESPFVIKVPVTGIVARYRIGFRGVDGAVIAHVDRRMDGSSSARTERTPGGVAWTR